MQQTPQTSPTPQDPEANPLSEASPASLEELFSRDPLGLSDRDIDKVVAELRSARERWAQAEATGTTRKASRAAPKVPQVTAPPDLDLDSLGL